MKRTMIAAAVLVSVFAASEVKAQSACGGNVVQNGDLSGNGRAWTFSCCPEGYRVQGVVYSDIRKQDHTDGVSVVCRSIKKGNDMIPSGDIQRNANQYVCDKEEVLAGISYKDVKVQGGDNRDSMDGLTAVCQRPGSSQLRTVYNPDIEGGRAAVDFTVLLPRRVVGVACKELDKGTSDRSDGCTIIVK